MTHLLLLRFSAMGDVALLAPVVQAFTDRYPDVSITLVTRPKFAVFFAQFPNVRVVKADVAGHHKGLAGLFRLFQELRKTSSFDLVVDANENLRTAVLKRLFRMAGVPSVTLDKGRAEKKNTNAKRRQNSPSVTPQHRAIRASVRDRRVRRSAFPIIFI